MEESTISDIEKARDGDVSKSRLSMLESVTEEKPEMEELEIPEETAMDIEKKDDSMMHHEEMAPPEMDFGTQLPPSPVRSMTSQRSILSKRSLGPLTPQVKVKKMRKRKLIQDRDIQLSNAVIKKVWILLYRIVLNNGAFSIVVAKYE